MDKEKKESYAVKRLADKNDEGRRFTESFSAVILLNDLANNKEWNDRILCVSPLILIVSN